MTSLSADSLGRDPEGLAFLHAVLRGPLRTPVPIPVALAGGGARTPHPPVNRPVVKSAIGA